MSLVNFITEHWCKSSLFNIFLTVFLKEVIPSVDVHNTAIHIPVRQHRISHIRHFLHSSKPVKSDLSVDAVVALLGAGAVPGSFDKARCNSIDGNAFWLKFFYQGFGQKMNGCLGDSVYKGGRICLLPDFLCPYLVITNKDKQLLAVGLKMFNGQYSTDYGALFAATAISIIPVLLIYLFFQKQFIAGIAASAVKG